MVKESSYQSTTGLFPNKRYDGIYSAQIMEVNDIKRQGRCLVYIPDLGGSTGDRETWIMVRYMSPFAGATPLLELGEDGIPVRDTGQAQLPTTDEQLRKQFEASQKSYGMWFPIPDVGNEVVVSFLNGRIDQGVIMGGFYGYNMNHMIPGIAGGKTYRHNANNSSQEYYPTTEYNKKDKGLIDKTDNPERPIHYPLYTGLRQQGLTRDYIRGTGTSGARRDVVSKSYGIATPRGTQFVLDDGYTDEDKSVGNIFTSTSPDTAKTNPASTTSSRKDELIRFRTRSGAQILINEEFGMIYIISRDGNNWIELANDGHIDIYGKESISIHSEGDLNLRANQNINIEAGNDINMKAVGDDGTGFGDITQFDEDGNVIAQGGPNNTLINGNIKLQSKRDIDFTIGDDFNVSVAGDHNETIGGNYNSSTSGVHNEQNGSKLVLINGTNDLRVAGTTKETFSSEYDVRFEADHKQHFGADRYSRLPNGGIDFGCPDDPPRTSDISCDDIPIASSAGGSSPAISPSINDLSTENKNSGDVKESITARVPQHEPWSGHIRSDAGEQSPKGEISETSLIATKPPTVTAETGGDVSTGASRQVPNEEIEQVTEIVKTQPLVGSLQASSSLGISPEGLDAIRKFESFLPYEYFDIKGFSIGYGHLQSGGPDPSFNAGITEEEAFDLFTKDVKLRENIIKRSLPGTTLTQGQFDALVSLVYNVGGLGLNLKTALRENRPNDAAEIFLQYAKSRNSNGQLEFNSALFARRQIELRMFTSGIYPSVVSRKEHELIGINTTITRWSKGFLEPARGVKTTTRQIQQANAAVIRVTGQSLPNTEASRPLALQGNISFA